MTEPFTTRELSNPYVLLGFWKTADHVRRTIQELYMRDINDDLDPVWVDGYDSALLDIRSWLDQILIHKPKGPK